jgi:hypothetical protein
MRNVKGPVREGTFACHYVRLCAVPSHSLCCPGVEVRQRVPGGARQLSLRNSVATVLMQ